MNGKELRDESTEEKKRIWEEVDQAASRAPGWVVSRIMSRGQANNRDKAQGDTDAPDASSR